MASLTFFHRTFTPKWQMWVLALLCILFFVYLGFWQIARAHQKQQMVFAQQCLSQKKPMPWRGGMSYPAQYQRIVVDGHFLNEVVLLDNQHQQHQFGYDVLSPLLTNDGKVVLVDRGWQLGDMTRQTFPHNNPLVGFAKVRGEAYYPSEKHWVLGQALEKIQPDLIVVERIDTKLISQFLHKSVYPFIIRLEQEDARGFVRQWPVVSMSPSRHFAYAFQWFVMALVILIIFVALNLKKT